MILTILWLGWILIFIARVADMTLATIRTLFLVRGRAKLAALIGFAEAFIYIIALNQIFRHMGNIWSFFFYAGGFACGNILGSYIEERMAIGFLVVQIIPRDYPSEVLSEKLRDAGFGVTVWEAEGLEGKHHVLNLVIRRKDRERLFSLVRSWDGTAFISVSEARTKVGGVFGRSQTK